MDSKLSVDCLLRLVDDLRLEDELLFCKKLFDKFGYCKIDFYPPYITKSSIRIETCVKNKEQMYQILLEDLNFKALKVLPHINHPNLNKQLSTYDVHCDICDKTMTFRQYTEQKDKHVHEEYQYTQEEYNRHIRTNSIVTKEGTGRINFN